MAQYKLQELLKSGPIPPGAAIDVGISVAGAIAKSPVGPMLLRADRIQVNTDGAVSMIGQRMPGATAEGDAKALGELLVQLIIGAPYNASQHKACVQELQNALELWPGGPDAIAAVLDLVAADPKAPGTWPLGHAEARLKEVRSRLGGSALGVWLKNLKSGTPVPAAETYGADPANPELATGMIPVGALAKRLQQAQEEADQTGEHFEAVLNRVAREPTVTPEPAPSPPPNVVRLGKPSTRLLVSGAMLWAMTAALALVALLLLAFLMS